MTPQARLSAAIEVLDRILAGAVAEQALTNWGRASRFAGSGDRHAVRDLVYDALRCKLSYAALGGAETGRGLVLGGLRDKGLEVAGLFTGEGHAPAPVSDFEAGGRPDELAALDCPDWLAPRLRTSLGADFAGVLQAMRQRAPVFLRVNQIKASLDEAQGALAAEGIATELTDLAKFGLRVTENPRKIQNSAAYVEGMVDLDYCCGGGGKALAMAARAKITLFCHDAEARRMRDLPARAQRAGVAVEILENTSLSAPYDVVLTDVPCSGSGSWRRDPQGKWALTEAKLSDLLQSQAEILDRAAVLVSAKGTLAYVTCSMLRDENEAQIEAFVTRHPDWICLQKQSFSPLSGADGFFLAVLTRRP
jgi:16S rRNA (cytosine967-C5)-methyltransferase